MKSIRISRAMWFLVGVKNSWNIVIEEYQNSLQRFTGYGLYTQVVRSQNSKKKHTKKWFIYNILLVVLNVFESFICRIDVDVTLHFRVISKNVVVKLNLVTINFQRRLRRQIDFVRILVHGFLYRIDLFQTLFLMFLIFINILEGVSTPY